MIIYRIENAKRGFIYSFHFIYVIICSSFYFILIGLHAVYRNIRENHISMLF